MAREVSRVAIEVRRGRALDETLWIEKNDGTPVDITGGTFELHYRINGTVYSLDGAFTITDAASGEVHLFVSSSATAAMPVGSGPFSFFWNPGGDTDNAKGFDGSFAVIDTVRP